jgi:hypothetical protein
MVAYDSSEVFPAPPETLWALLRSHLDDRILRIHGLIRSQRMISQSGAESVLDRSIDVRGKLMKSRWKLTYRPPDFSRWEILESEGPWAAGTYLENAYAAAPGGTTIRSRGELRISVLPFFIPQGPAVRRVLDTVDREDRSFIREL